MTIREQLEIEMDKEEIKEMEEENENKKYFIQIKTQKIMRMK